MATFTRKGLKPYRSDNRWLISIPEFNQSFYVNRIKLSPAIRISPVDNGYNLEKDFKFDDLILTENKEVSITIKPGSQKKIELLNCPEFKKIQQKSSKLATNHDDENS